MEWIKQHITAAPSFSRCLEEIEVIEDTIISNPSLCVDTCKCLVESICKTILTNKGEDFAADISFAALVKLTIASTLNHTEDFKADILDLSRRMAGVADKLGDIRNHNGFASHGLDVLNPRLTETVSIFASKIADNIGGFILNCYLNNRVVTQDKRLHYIDCQPFNEYFDDLNPIALGTITISSSEALFKQDYEAYKEEYYIYLQDLEEGLEKAQ